MPFQTSRGIQTSSLLSHSYWTVFISVLRKWSFSFLVNLIFNSDDQSSYLFKFRTKKYLFCFFISTFLAIKWNYNILKAKITFIKSRCSLFNNFLSKRIYVSIPSPQLYFLSRFRNLERCPQLLLFPVENLVDPTTLFLLSLFLAQRFDRRTRYWFRWDFFILSIALTWNRQPSHRCRLLWILYNNIWIF